MITFIQSKPERTVDIIGYGLDSYVDKYNKTVWKVCGIISPSMRGRLVPRVEEGETLNKMTIRDIYIDEASIILFRSNKKEEAEEFKHFLDLATAQRWPLVSVEEFHALKEKLKDVNELIDNVPAPTAQAEEQNG